jgi:molybdopterin-containing oxidoreductase family membrane subunit
MNRASIDDLAETRREVEADGLKTLEPVKVKGRIWFLVLWLVFLWGAFAYVVQLVFGLRVTAMRDYVSWGLYIATFVFFIGISHVGALMSAILRLTGAEWRRPITRMAEAITFASLVFGGLMPVLDMGRPDRLHHLVLHGRVQSPVLWDILCIGTYFVGSTLFLYLPLVPDIAVLREHLSGVGRFKKRLYRTLSLGWEGTPDQQRRLERCMTVMTAIILPIAVSVHTVVSWIFATTLRPGWNSTIFGPYFVSGALMSGCAAVMVAMGAFRHAYRLERYVTPAHFRRLGLILFALTLIYLYFNVNEYWTLTYKMETAEGRLLHDLFHGSYAPLYWSIQILGILVPLLILGFRRGRSSVRLSVIASLLIVVTSWVKRYVIVVPSMMHPHLGIHDAPAEWSDYFPSVIEWSITAGSLAGFLLLYTGFSRLFPIVSMWETAEGGSQTTATDRIADDRPQEVLECAEHTES